MQGSKKESYKRTDTPLPFLDCRKGVYAVPLSGDIYTNRFFENIDDNSNMIVTVTYQNKFGVKKTTKRRFEKKEDFD